MMKQVENRKWLTVLLAILLLATMTGCGEDHGREGSELSGSVDNPNTRYAKLMSVNRFKETFKSRGKMTDNSDDEGSTENGSGVSLLVRGIDGDANVFNYIDVTGEVDLEDLDKEKYIPEFLKGLNNNSDTYHYSKMELMDRGANFYEFKVKIANIETGEELSSVEESSEAESSGTQAEQDNKPMVFFFIEKGGKTYEIIGLDMEAENAMAFSDSFQGILDEIVTIQEVSSKETAS